MIDRFIAMQTGGYNRLRMRNPYTYFTEEQKARWPADTREIERSESSDR